MKTQSIGDENLTYVKKHRIIALEGPQRTSSSTPCSNKRPISFQKMIVQSLEDLAVKIIHT